jgi:diguanylate cyclase (GGDEF)-like protein
MTDMRVLAAEDSPTQAAVLRAHLEGAGFAVALASNGAEALQLMDEEPFDLVVSDVVMPDVDGYELCRQVKERYPNVPVVLLTSMTDPLDVVNALGAGADNFMRKPYEPTELIHRIRNMLHNKQLREAGRTQMGLELFFLGRRFMINSDREQILDLLVSTFEDLVAVNQRLSAREEDLAAARDDLRSQLTEVEAERDRLDAVLAALPSGMAVFDREGRVVHANQKMADLIDVPRSDLNGSVIWESLGFVDNTGAPIPRDTDPLHTTLTEGHGAVLGAAFDLFIERHGGAPVPVVARTEPVRGRDGSIVGAVGTLEDLRMLMDHDAVTGLPGHGILVDRLDGAAELAAERGAKTAVVVAVVDRFHRLRKSLPASEVDHVLSTVASRLRTALDSPEIEQRALAASAAYLGEGEFAVVLPEVADETDAVVVAQQLVERLAGTVLAGDVDVALTVTAAIGMCDDEPDPPTLVGTVAASARAASRAGGGRVAASDGGRHEHVLDVLRREAQLRAALDHDELVVHYQPQLTIREERPVAVEALVRWEHPARGLLGAGEVVPVAVECGLIAQVGWHVLETACADGARWHRELSGGAPPVLSVNLAAEQLTDPDAAERIADILERTGFDPTALVLEITEGSVMDDAGLARERLSRIKALGCRIAIDDFGTGYSSLLQLRSFPVDVLKIDRSFVAGMLEEPADAAIVTTVIRLARALGLEVVAEGVENVDQIVQLRVLGCDLGQGFHWARAMPADETARWWSVQASAEGLAGAGGEGVAQTDQHQDEVISYLVHELRSPLTAISGFAQLLQSSTGDVPTGEFVDAIVRNADELENRLASLREVNQVLRGGLTLRTEDSDVAQVVDTLVRDMAPQLEPHPVTFSSTGSARSSIDGPRLLQAVGNLVTNAAKFSPAEAPIEVSVHADGPVITIEVRDHGRGIPPERRPELFRRFSRLGSSATGMGLGLYLARLIVEAHGGLLRYDDAHGGGAQFSIRLPRRSAAPTAASPEPMAAARPTTSAPPAAGEGRSGAAVLCVEDDAATAGLIERVLAHHDVSAVADGAEALEAVGDLRPDVVLLDRHVGGIHGDEVLRLLRSDPGTEHVPVMILTGDADEHIIRELLASGADAVLGKPFTPDKLRATVDLLLQGGARSAAVDVQHVRPPNAPDPEEPLDPALTAAIEELGTDTDDLHGLVRTAVDDAHRQVVALHEAVAAGDSEPIVRHAHALAGALGNFGAHVVRARCRALEEAARSTDASQLRRAVEAVEDAVSDAEQALVERFPGAHR